MDAQEFIFIAGKRKMIIIFALFLFTAIAAVYVFRSPLEYRATARLLIIANSGSSNAPLDPYVAAKSNEYLAGLLTKVVASNAFYEEALAAGFNFDRQYFSGDAEAQLLKWNRAVEAYADGTSGIIEIRAYHPDKYQAEQLAQAVLFTLKEKHQLYHSSGNKVSLKVIDQPLVSNWPERPNLPVAFGAALLLGLFFGLFYIYLFSYPLREYLPGPVESMPPPTKQAELKGELPPVRPAPTAVPVPAAAPAMPVESGYGQSPRPDQAIGRGDMRNILSHKGL